MRSRAAGSRIVPLPAVLILVLATTSDAQEPGPQDPAAEEQALPEVEATPAPGGGWSARANLNLAGSYGNAGSGSLGLSAAAARQAGRVRLNLNGGVLRTNTDAVERRAFGSAEDFTVQRTVTSQTSADRSHLRARATAPTGGRSRLRYYAAAGWERDAPAGIRSRYDLTVGVGTTWGGPENAGRRPFELGVGLSAVHQRDEVEDPDTAAGSLGFRVDARAQGRYRAANLALVSASTWNLRNTDDLRFDVTGSVEFPFSPRLAFRTSLQTLFDSRPSLERVPLFAAAAGPPGGTVAVPRGKTDVILLVSLVVRF